ncbi:carboxypeptidase C prc1 [Tritrichomonas musculus]|uniref:Carboxypeptidase C prc1 n=1 Tax=Tritrichomonas musculus TaxID=1915356 RepID=A0ABR2GVE6_9EUKA
MKKINDPPIIKFEIDRSLASIWEALQLSSEEIKERKKHLMTLLNETYTEFVKSEYFEYDKVNHTLIEAKSNFRKTKEMLGDFKTFITSAVEKLPIKEQIVAVNKLTVKMLEENKDQIEQSKSQFRYLQTLYNQLGIPQNRRGEFKRDEKTEYTASRLIRMNNKIEELQQEKTRRIEINNNLTKSINQIAQKTEEKVDDDVKEISQKKRVTSSALTRLEQTNSSLIDLDKSRMEQVRYLIRQIKDLYSLLAIDQRDWIQFSYSPTTGNISLLEKELEFLESQKEERLPSVIDLSQKEINRLSEFLQIPTNQRPKYYGNDKTEEARYYQNAISKLEIQANQSGLSQSNFGPNGSPDKNYMKNTNYSNHSAQTDKNKNHLDNSSQTERKLRSLQNSPKTDRNMNYLENSPQPSKNSRYFDNSPKTEIHSKFIENSPQTEIHSKFIENSPEPAKKPLYYNNSPQTEIHSKYLDNSAETPQNSQYMTDQKHLVNSPETPKNSPYLSTSSRPTRNSSYSSNSPKTEKHSNYLTNLSHNDKNSRDLLDTPEIDRNSRYSSGNSLKPRSKISNNNSPSMTDYSLTSALFASPPKKKSLIVDDDHDTENTNEYKSDEIDRSDSLTNIERYSIPAETPKTPSPSKSKREMTEMLMRSRDPFYTYV